ncbi:MAG TPA: RagB/SusD family nutrient uptake outer membrane protein [Gemmatimonadales bacterium]|nr:RagB/SusD family nutrient uptake outer membrane protein [Gemmatimonadales bacterium]
MAAAAVTYACKDFLDQPAQGTVDEQTLATKAGVEGTLIAAYRSLDCSSSSAGSWGCAASNWVWGSVTSDDAYKGSNLGDQQPINDIETYYWSVGIADDYINQKWSQVYDGVARANATLRLLTKVRLEKPGEISNADAARIRGEALFLRAHYHFEAYRMWGKVPYYYETDTDFRKANDLSADSVAKLVIADLDTAITLLPAVQGDKGRANAWTARAYKGRVQVYRGDYAGALVTLRNVQTAGPYALETSFDRVWTGFTTLRNGPETILAFQASVRDGEPSGWNSNWGERLNFPHSGSYFGCCGFHQPAFNLVNFYQVDAAGLPVAMTSSAWNTPVPDSNFAGGMIRPVDPRLDWTVGRDNVPYKDWGLHNRGWIRDASYSGPYSPKKNVHERGCAAPCTSAAENNVGWQASQTNDVNIHIFRYADMLLLLAEAEVEAGVLENARAIVNQIRERAGQVAQGCGFGSGGSVDSALVANYPSCADSTSMTVALVQNPTLDSVSTPWAQYRIGLYPGPWTVQATARQAVRYERRLELAMEGQRFFDLRRWGAADSTITNYLASERVRIPYLALAAPYTARYRYYPIPTVQIELSRVGTTDRLCQNQGWGGTPCP